MTFSLSFCSFCMQGRVRELQEGSSVQAQKRALTENQCDFWSWTSQPPELCEKSISAFFTTGL